VSRDDINNNHNNNNIIIIIIIIIIVCREGYQVVIKKIVDMLDMSDDTVLYFMFQSKCYMSFKIMMKFSKQNVYLNVTWRSHFIIIIIKFSKQNDHLNVI
jgi:hypothetical protein